MKHNKEENPDLKPEENKNASAYLDSLGWVLYKKKDYKEAKKQLIEATKDKDGEGQHVDIYDHLGDVYLKEGKVKEAIAQWQLSLKEWEKSTQSEMDSSEVAKVTKKLESARVRLARESQR